MNANYVDFFRFNDGYEDVFVEDDGYLYACADPFGWAHMLCCREVRTAVDLFGNECIYPQAINGADWQYLETLEPAPDDIARRIIEACTETAKDPGAYSDAMCDTIEGIAQSGEHYECYVNSFVYICGPVEA